jgi:predicted GH43/DUF377 family glycosyl hydrolase
MAEAATSLPEVEAGAGAELEAEAGAGGLFRRIDARLDPDPARVVSRLFVPGEELMTGRPRVDGVVKRVLALSEADVTVMARQIRDRFSGRHPDLDGLLSEHAMIASVHLHDAGRISRDRAVVLGATLTSEYAVEGAALCNPSAMLHPDQRALAPGQARLAVSLRAIGEGHLSSIGFCEAVVGPGPSWAFSERPLPVVAGVPAPTTFQRENLRAILQDSNEIDEFVLSVLDALPPVFDSHVLENILDEVPVPLISRQTGKGSKDRLRHIVSSVCRTSFAPDAELGQQVLMPTNAEERLGLEDARFVLFREDDGTTCYLATYTAWDGEQIAPRVFVSADLRVFEMYRPAGPAAHNKGMALFPRRVGGRFVALCRPDGETNGVAFSDDGRVWGDPIVIAPPSLSWELMQVGNCGSPIETPQGWLVLTHGVGPMRVYSIGALLLDLEDPTRVIARLAEPLITPTDGHGDGYVPNVVYSCGGVVHDGVVWLPYAVGDSRIEVGWVTLDDLLDAMTPEPVHAVLAGGQRS